MFQDVQRQDNRPALHPADVCQLPHKNAGNQGDLHRNAIAHKVEEKPSTNTGSRKNSQSSSFLQKTQNIGRDIDIRGMMVDEAEMTLGKFIDDAVIAGLSQVLIIHGKGTGALRKGVHAYLKGHRNVLSFQFADINEGGTGATVVELK